MERFLRAPLMSDALRLLQPFEKTFEMLEAGRTGSHRVLVTLQLHLHLFEISVGPGPESKEIAGSLPQAEVCLEILCRRFQTKGRVHALAPGSVIGDLVGAGIADRRRTGVQSGADAQRLG